MKLKLVVMCACVMFYQIAHAEAYKCMVGGEITYSQEPCVNETATMQQMPNVGKGAKEKSIYIAESLRTADISLLGVKASMRDSEGCVGERERQCLKFINSIDLHKLTEIYASILADRFSAEDINNIYGYCKDGPGRKEMDIVIVEISNKIFPDKPVNAATPLAEEDIARRVAFFKTPTGVRFKDFLKDSANEYKKVSQPYLSVLARQAGLVR